MQSDVAESSILPHCLFASAKVSLFICSAKKMRMFFCEKVKYCSFGYSCGTLAVHEKASLKAQYLRLTLGKSFVLEACM